MDFNTDITYNYTYLPPLPMANKVPFPGFSLEWAFLAGVQLVRTLLNTLANNLARPLEDLETYVEDLENAAARDNVLMGTLDLVRIAERLSHDGYQVGDLLNVLHAIRTALVDKDSQTAMEAAKSITQQIQANTTEHVEAAHPTTIEAYKDLFRIIPLPKSAADFDTDEAFAERRVAGPNPLVVSQVSAPLKNFPLSDAQYQSVMGSSDSIQAAIDSKRLYICDYAPLNGAIQGSFPKEQKFLGAPMALFALPIDGGNARRLKPVAIQTGQDPSKDAIIVNPGPAADDSQRANWNMAKTMVDTSDGNYHEAISHLGQTHLVMEVFSLATDRVLEGHPVGQLLLPHFEGTYFINNAAQSSLIAAGGVIDEIMGGTIDQSRIYGVLGAQLRLLNYNAGFLKDTLAARGVAQPSDLPYYPYRDNALLIWNAIETWASDYVDVFYASDQAVADDRQLQDWLAELTAHEGGRMQNIGENGRFSTKAYLKTVLTDVMFTASAQHAAVNFPQASIMSFSPTMPLAGYQAAPDNSPKTETDWIAQMPPLNMALQQLSTGTLLGSVYYTRLGYYPKNTFENPEVLSALTNFQNTLKGIEETMKAADPEGQYPYLLPSRIPRSINI